MNVFECFLKKKMIFGDNVKTDFFWQLNRNAKKYTKNDRFLKFLFYINQNLENFISDER